jgi:RNA polymerase sigma-54 factor
MFVASTSASVSGFDSAGRPIKLQCNIAAGIEERPAGGVVSMALSAKLQLRQTQSLVITPQLLQAIRLLQLSGPDLDRMVASEIEQNPLLERAEAAEPSVPSEEGASWERAPADEPTSDEGGEYPSARAERAQFDGAPYRSSVQDAPADWAARDFGRPLEIVAPESLAASLDRQIEATYGRSPGERLIALSLVACLDPAGYLTALPEAVAERFRAPLATVERVLKRLRDWAPTGMFARGLADCLALQLAERNRLDPAMVALLANLDRLAARDLAGLCRVCGVDRADLAEMIAEIRALDPKPGLAFADEPVSVSIPDVLVRPGPDGGWVVELNDEALPRLIVHHTYHAEVLAHSRAESERDFLSDCLQKANWLERSLDQRARTILKVASEIIRHQSEFLHNGISALRPLNLRMVADVLGIHESTVSRAAANKLMATPRGTFEFRFFFSGAIPAISGSDSHSAEAVKHRIRALIQNESPASILSDDAIVMQLGREGIDIARRTVAKYRESMRIGSSVERRREKRFRAAS